jgi:hypothetical protein
MPHKQPYRRFFKPFFPSAPYAKQTNKYTGVAKYKTNKFSKGFRAAAGRNWFSVPRPINTHSTLAETKQFQIAQNFSTGVTTTWSGSASAPGYFPIETEVLVCSKSANSTDPGGLSNVLGSRITPLSLRLLGRTTLANNLGPQDSTANINSSVRVRIITLQLINCNGAYNPITSTAPQYSNMLVWNGSNFNIDCSQLFSFMPTGTPSESSSSSTGPATWLYCSLPFRMGISSKCNILSDNIINLSYGTQTTQNIDITTRVPNMIQWSQTPISTANTQDTYQPNMSTNTYADNGIFCLVISDNSNSNLPDATQTNNYGSVCTTNIFAQLKYKDL